MESSLPVRAEDEEGDLRKVDLSLEETSSGYETENALVGVQIPESVEEPVTLGEEGVGIKLAGADEDRVARPFGDGNAFASEVLIDTDMLISPIATGVEVFNLLRSENSPETLRFQVQMPAGAELRADGDWGAEVVRDGELLTTIREPIALDAQGTDVPVELQVEGDYLALTVDHREGDYAMPILLDPILENDENWIYGQNHNALEPGIWAYNNTSWPFYGSTYCIYECFGPAGESTRGLYVSLEGQRWYSANEFGQWSYSAPNGNSYISSATLGTPYVREDHGCSGTQYPQPHDYFGIWAGSSWTYISVGSANYPGGNYTLPFSGQAVVFGLGTGGGVPWIPCWRDLYAGGAHVWLDDNNWPSVYSLADPPAHWIKSTEAFQVRAQASDAGLGVKNVLINAGESGIIRDIKQQDECAGTRRSPCLTGHTASWDLEGADFREGRRVHSVVAYDPLDKYSNPYYFETKVDGGAPEVTLDGQLAEATEEDEGEQQGDAEVEKLRLPVYNLKIEAKDGIQAGAEKDWRSGVEDIEVYLDGVEQEVPWSPTPSCAYSCPKTETYSLNLSKVPTAGLHKLLVRVNDFVGNVRERDIEFEYFPATGIKDEYVMHYFPLPDGSGNEAEEEHPRRPELAVNVMNGNLVYREQDIDVEGASALDLEVERYYNSQLPTSENTEWGDGWTLAQTPGLDPIKAGGSSVPNEAEILDSSGAIEEEVGLPTEAGAQKFDPALQATLTKKPSGGYELTDETGESATSVAFDETGQTEALLSDSYAKVDYSYEGGELADIEVIDPATFAADPEELEIPEPELITKPTFAGAFGSNGSGDGQLKSPGDVAVDIQGNLWVVDKDNDRVQKFGPGGEFLAKFGSSGTGDGQFHQPTSIAIASNGNLLVTDAGNARVQRFSSAGAYISKFGSKGAGNGQFTGPGPEGIAIDPVGSIWVSDTYGGRVQKFNSAGEFVKVVGSKGSGSGQLGEPTGIDVDPSGNVWVADWQNNRVSVFDSNGEFLSQFGSFGSGDGQFSHPDEIEIDKLGNVWVGDQSNNRVQQFDLAAQFKRKFGSAGSGPGQFSFTYPMGIAADSKGHLWIADVHNHRIQEWLVPIERPAYTSSFGSYGSGDGQLISPGDVAVGIEGNLWVVDRANNRVQKFDPSGKFLAKFGSSGSGDGQLNRPTSIVVDRDGNLLIADAKNNRIQKFNPEGQFISAFGSYGADDGEFSGPEGIATDFEGNIWVADTYNGRIQKFDEDGEFLEVVGSRGEEPGQLGEPTGIDVDPSGNVWVADWRNNRVSVFGSDGEFLDDFGSFGTGNGQFQQPDEIEVDAQGNVWVGDQNNGRIQRFDLSGAYVGQFGSKGSGEGQFSFAFPMGIAADRQGHIWITDVNNHRIQEWLLGNYAPVQAPELDLSDGDPKVEVETPGNLVSSVAGSAAGEHAYVHSGDDLIAHDGPEGETKYEYDAAGRMTEVTLANGTWGQIAYFSDGRVKSVTVAPEGVNSKKTVFEYQDEPTRRTVVIPPDEPHVTYDIGADGSVVKWWNTDEPPTIEPLLGTLYTNRETATPISAGDYYLTAKAYSPEGVASLDIVVNGNTLVDEVTCEQDEGIKGLECVNPPVENEWVTETGEHVPGILHVEVLATDRDGDTAAERFWVNIPEPPPPPPAGFPEEPKFKDIKRFREEYGLEVVFPVANEVQLNERIYSTINAWHNPNTPAGQVARASWERWGVPLRPQDVAELEYRDSYLAHNGPAISSWGEEHAPTTYAGYYMNHRAGGIMQVGFTNEQQVRLTQLKTEADLKAPDRMEPFPFLPARSYQMLRSLQESVAVATTASQSPPISVVDLDIEGNSVRVGTADVSSTIAFLNKSLGSMTGLDVFRRENIATEYAGRYQAGRPFLAGMELRNPTDQCTAGFGAWSRVGTKGNGDPIKRRYVLTAGHCFPLAEGNAASVVSRSQSIDDPTGGVAIGRVDRRGFFGDSSRIDTDAEAVWLTETSLVPGWVYECCGGRSAMRPRAPVYPAVGQIVCQSSRTLDRVVCGPVLGEAKLERLENKEKRFSGWHWLLRVGAGGGPGDSGAPVWIQNTGQAVGLVAGGGAAGLAVTPFERPPNAPVGQIAGVFSDPYLSPSARPLHLQIGP